RLLGRFQKSEILSVKGKYITIENADALSLLAGTGTSQINVSVSA
ncbi:MAG: transcriptional regulator FNR, partial [Chania sp.]